MFQLRFSISFAQVFLYRKTIQVLGDVISQSCILGWSSCSLSDLFNLVWIQSFITFVFHHSTLSPSVAMAARQSGVFVRYIRPTSQLFHFCRIKLIVTFSRRLRIVNLVVSSRVSNDLEVAVYRRPVSRRSGPNTGVGMRSLWFLKFYNNAWFKSINQSISVNNLVT